MRKLFSSINSLNQCLQCQRANNNACWNVDASAKGNWGSAHCCNDNDWQCNEKVYCSNKVGQDQEALLWMACPVDKNNCPSAQESSLLVN